MGKAIRFILTVGVTLGCAYVAVRIGVIVAFALRFTLDRRYAEILEACRHLQSCSVNQGSVIALKVVLGIISSPVFYFGIFGLLGGLMGWAIISKLLK